MIWRIVDASLNRAAEGIRVAEEILRFCGGDRGYLTLKRVRHEIRKLFKPFDRHLLVARDTESDPGRVSGTADEYIRTGLEEVFSANLKRAQEALRVLEETIKTESPFIAAETEKFRFEVYRVEKEWSGRVGPRIRLKNSLLYVVCSRPSEEAVRIAKEVAGIADLFQLRLKGMSGREYVETAKDCKRIFEGSGTLFVVNDRPDVAAIAEADGVHLGNDDPAVTDARKVFRGLVGATVHNRQDLKEALTAGADYLGVGAFFPTKTKKDAYVRGFRLAEMMKGVDVVWFAIGGVTEERLEELVEWGVGRVAVGEAICGAEKPGLVAQRIKERLHHLLKKRRQT